MNNILFAFAALRALETINFEILYGNPLTIITLENYPVWIYSNLAKIVIENLDGQIDNKALYKTFSAFGDVVTCMTVQVFYAL